MEIFLPRVKTRCPHFHTLQRKQTERFSFSSWFYFISFQWKNNSYGKKWKGKENDFYHLRHHFSFVRKQNFFIFFFCNFCCFYCWFLSLYFKYSFIYSSSLACTFVVLEWMERRMGIFFIFNSFLVNLSIKPPPWQQYQRFVLFANSIWRKKNK